MYIQVKQNTGKIYGKNCFDVTSFLRFCYKIALEGEKKIISSGRRGNTQIMTYSFCLLFRGFKLIADH